MDMGRNPFDIIYIYSTIYRKCIFPSIVSTRNTDTKPLNLCYKAINTPFPQSLIAYLQLGPLPATTDKLCRTKNSFICPYSITFTAYQSIMNWQLAQNGFTCPAVKFFSSRLTFITALDHFGCFIVGGRNLQFLACVNIIHIK